MTSRKSLVPQLKMKNAGVFTTCLFLFGLLQTFQGVYGAPHESPPSPRKPRQLIASDGYIANIRNYPQQDDYNVQYFMSYFPSYRQSRRGDNELVAAASGVNMKSDKTLLAEEISLGKPNGFYDPFYYFVPESDASSGNGRIRRNSHGTHMTPMYPESSYENQRDTAYMYDRNHMASNNVFPQQSARRLYRNPNQFLTKQQITAAQARFNQVDFNLNDFSEQAQARYYSPSSNFIENREPNHYNNNNGSPYYRTNRNANLDHDIDNGRQDDEAWSIQVGTQLKVNDDGRERNPEQFYVRDETRGSSHSHNRRYSPYYRS